MNPQGRIIFHHVVRQGGFAAAARALPYGIGEAAVRKHFRALEQEMGAVLCHRQPFRLTPEGRKLYEHDRPHIEALAPGAFRLRSRGDPKLLAGVTGSAAKHFLIPAVRIWLGGKPRGAIETRTGSLSQLLPKLQSGELDLLITALDGDPPGGFASHLLATFPLVLLAPFDSPLQSAEELWLRKTIEEPLISPEAEDPVALAFERGLQRGGIGWPTRLTHDSPAEVMRLVTAGLGLGLSLAARPQESDRRQATTADNAAPGIRELRLPGFDPVRIVTLWRPEDSRRLQEPLRLLRGSALRNDNKYSIGLTDSIV